MTEWCIVFIALFCVLVIASLFYASFTNAEIEELKERNEWLSTNNQQCAKRNNELYHMLQNREVQITSLEHSLADANSREVELSRKLLAATPTPDQL